jgi:hypothetical protein
MKVGVVVPLEARPETGHVVRYVDARAFAQQAAATGFDSLWLYDHLLYRAPKQPTHGIWEAWTILSALAEATVQLELGITQAVLLDPTMPHGHKLVLLALLHELAFDAWTDITAEGISRRYHMGLRQAKERLRALVALGVIKEKCVYQTDGDKAPRPRYLRRLHRDAINDYWFPKGTSTPALPVSRPSPGDFYDRFNALVSIRDLVHVSHTGKFKAFWRGEQHASVHLHPPDATCPYEHAYDYGDNNRHMDAYDVYCLTKGFYRWDGTLHLDKRAGMRAARAEYPTLQSERALTVTGFREIVTHQEAGKKGGRGHQARPNGTRFKRGNSAAYTLARLKRDHRICMSRFNLGRRRPMRRPLKQASAPAPDGNGRSAQQPLTPPE